MKQTTEKLFSKFSSKESFVEEVKEESTEVPKDDRRSFLKKAAIGGLSLGAFALAPVEKTIAYTTQKINRYSSPSDLKITDMRIEDFELCPILKIDTNQGVYGLGDVRDGADKRYAREMTGRKRGKNPAKWELIFKEGKQLGGPEDAQEAEGAGEVGGWGLGAHKGVAGVRVRGCGWCAGRGSTACVVVGFTRDREPAQGALPTASQSPQGRQQLGRDRRIAGGGDERARRFTPVA